MRWPAGRPDNGAVEARVRDHVRELCAGFPFYPGVPGRGHLAPARDRGRDALSVLWLRRYPGQGFAADRRSRRDPAAPVLRQLRGPLHDLRARAAARTDGDQKDGQREPFDRDKLARSIYVALRKRPVEPERIERIINSLVRQLESSGETDIPSDMIGESGDGGAGEPRPGRLCPLRLGLSQFPRGQGFRRFCRADRCGWRLRRRPRAADLRRSGAYAGGAGAGPARARQRWPNPAVGCVLVNDGRVVGRGWTQPGGRPHAETEALARAGHARPRRHRLCQPRTVLPPGPNAALRRGADRSRRRRVVAAVEDPDPRVDGGGIHRLRAAGIAVEIGLCADAAAEINAGFFSRVRQGRPLVTVKLATTLDGRIAMPGGESRWITGAPARARAHLLRARHDAVMVGIGTVLADDPELTCRLNGLDRRPPVRIIVDRQLRIPPTARLLAEAGAATIWLLAAASADPNRRPALEASGARVIEVADRGDGIDLAAALAALGTRGITRLLVEGGARLVASLLKARLVDRLAWFHAPRLIGADGIAAIGALGIAALAEAPGFERASTETVGADLLTTFRARDLQNPAENCR